jgi:hypothetical protein
MTHFTSSCAAHYTSSPQRKDRFQLGQELTPDELKHAYICIHNKPVPKGQSYRAIAATLARACPLRFEYEVNRQRGWAFDAEDLVE